jgi:hypothetical protein
MLIIEYRESTSAKNQVFERQFEKVQVQVSRIKFKNLKC